MRVKKYNTIALLSVLSFAVAACGSEGGKTIQLESSSAQRAQAGKNQIAAAEAAARAADKRANPNSPNVTIRTGTARTSSMDGTNWSANQASTVPNTPTAQTASPNSNNDNSMLIMAGIAAFALFGKEIIKGGSSVVAEAGSALKSVVTPKDKEGVTPSADKPNPSASAPQAADAPVPAKSGAIQLPGGPVGPQVGVTPGPGSGPTASQGNLSNNQAAALPAKADQPQQVAAADKQAFCFPNQKSILTEIKKFWNDASKTADSEVRL